VPEVAGVTGRIYRIQRFYRPEASVIMIVKLETLDVAGARIPFAANAGTVIRRSGTIMFRLQGWESPPADVLRKARHRGVRIFARETELRFQKGLESEWVRSRHGRSHVFTALLRGRVAVGAPQCRGADARDGQRHDTLGGADRAPRTLRVRKPP